MILRGKTEVLGQKLAPLLRCLNTNPTWTGVELKLVLCAEMPANYYGFIEFCLLASKLASRQQYLTNACCCMYSLELLMMDGMTVRNM